MRPVRVDPAGRLGPTRGQAQGPRHRRTGPGWYVPAAVPDDLPEQRILEQSVRLPADGAVTGWAALRLHRANFFDGLAGDGRTRFPVPLAVGRGSKMRGGERIVLSREPLEPEEVTWLDGIRCTVPNRALFDEARRLRELREAVVAIDMATAALLTSIRRMREYWSHHRSWRRATLVEEALGLASEESRSPQETRYRLVWVLDAGLPPPLVNQRVWDRDGNLLGIADLLDEEAGLVGEFDGADHRTMSRHTHDLSRQQGFERHGLQVCRVTGLDLVDRARVVDRIHFHRSRALGAPPDQRAWTVTPPRGWEREQTLDGYLEEREFFDQVRRAEG